MLGTYGRPELGRRGILRLAREGWPGTLVLPLVAVAWVVLAAGGQPSASASTPVGPDAVVSSAGASPADLTASGGTVAVTGTGRSRHHLPAGAPVQPVVPGGLLS